ncbi:amidohydrolase family protein [Nonomuraea sp. ZG12]|uniref:metal-dependent hydrolase family protein n=1 Tax=Nonomuraea sp. ZG12 TaxID=3452207 RepID=UPI003F8A1A30
MLVLHGGTIIDGTGGDPVTGSGLRLDGDRIAGFGTDGGTVTLDADGLTVLPGLIDLHSHLGLVDFGEVGTPPALLAAAAFANLELCLDAGFTTVRELGGLDGGMVGALRQGLVRGPRLLPSGPLLCQSGGHGDLGPSFLPHSHDVPSIPGLIQRSQVCDGPDEVRKAARMAFRHGATQLKMCVSGGVVSHNDAMEDTQFSVAEMRAAVEEARARGTYVTAHAHNADAIRMGLEAGIECFEHATYLTEEVAAQVAAAGAALDFTVSICELLREQAPEWGVPETGLPKLEGAAKAAGESLLMAREHGILVGSGSDLLGRGQNRRGLEVAHRARLVGAMAAIVTATASNARILRLDDEIGTLQAGKRADVIAVSGDPLAEPELFDDPARVVLVIQDGRIVKDTLNLAGKSPVGGS